MERFSLRFCFSLARLLFNSSTCSQTYANSASTWTATHDGQYLQWQQKNELSDSKLLSPTHPTCIRSTMDTGCTLVGCHIVCVIGIRCVDRTVPPCLFVLGPLVFVPPPDSGIRDASTDANADMVTKPTNRRRNVIWTYTTWWQYDSVTRRCHCSCAFAYCDGGSSPTMSTKRTTLNLIKAWSTP